MGEHLFVPFGKAIPRKAGTTYFTASSRQECMICKYIQGNQNYVGTAFYELCNGMWPEYMAMVRPRAEIEFRGGEGRGGAGSGGGRGRESEGLSEE
jgi:hypothetical protein